MGNSGKVWVIPSSRKRSSSKKVDKAVDSGLEERLRYVAASLMEDGGAGTDKKAGGSARTPFNFVAVISYFLGPFSILAVEDGRKSRFWLSTLCIFVLGLAVFTAGLVGRLDTAGGGAWVIPAWLASAAVGVITGVAAWSRGLVLAGRRSRTASKVFPRFAQCPWGAGMLGMALPGFGLYSNGRRGRAAAAVWPVAFIALSAIILCYSSQLWDSLAGAESYGYGGRFLEYIFMSAAALGFLGVVFWIFQSLDGARLAGQGAAGNIRRGGDIAAVMLLISLIAFGSMFQKDYVAETLHGKAGDLFDEGYRVIPVYIESAAVKVDPSRPEYSVKLMEFYEGVNDIEKARAVRAELVASFVPCAGFIRESGLARLGNNRIPGQIKDVTNALPAAGETFIHSGPIL